MPKEQLYEVSHIVDEDYSNPNQRVFLIRWLGYTSDDDSWEPMENLECGAIEVVRDWDKKKKQEQKRNASETKVNANNVKTSSSQIRDEPRKASSQRVKSSQTVGLSDISRKLSRQRGIASFLEKAQKRTNPRLHVQAGPTSIKTKASTKTERKLVDEKEETPTSEEDTEITEPVRSLNNLSYKQSEDEEVADTEKLDDDSPTRTRRTQNRQSPPDLYADFRSALDSISGPPVWVVNDVDSEPCPPLVFKWVEEYHLGSNVPVRDDHFSTGCSCPGDECDLRDPDSCECLDDSDEKKFAYDIDGLIHHQPGTAIIECNNRCGCGRTCPNRVVQRGRRMPLEIFKTQKKGWGVRTCRPIPKGMFICRYLGEVITDAEAERRGEEYDRKGITYLFDLDFFRNDPNNAADAGSPEPMGSLFCVDAMHYGNVSRFFNHSCNPNIAIYTVVRNGDNRVYDLAMFAIKPIKPYEELCFDYKTKKGVKVRQQCLCGERNCRGWLFGN